MPFLSTVVLPRGIVDSPRPAGARYAACRDHHRAGRRERTQPGVAAMFVQARHAIHGAPSWLARAGSFPRRCKIEYPLAQEAERYYRNARRSCSANLPFWLANLIDRMWVVLASLSSS